MFVGHIVHQNQNLSKCMSVQCAWFHCDIKREEEVILTNNRD